MGDATNSTSFPLGREDGLDGIIRAHTFALAMHRGTNTNMERVNFGGSLRAHNFARTAQHGTSTNMERDSLGGT